MKKHLISNLKILFLMTVYLFFHFTNAFFADRGIITNSHRATVRQGTMYIFHLQKTAKITISETRLSFTQLIQKASKFFIILLFFAAIAAAIYYFFHPKNGFSSGPPYLRSCVIRI